jgi:putative ABC transport system ATP-binding protein
MITVNNLSKIFTSGDAEIKAVNDVSFVIPEGQFVAITGRSGSGKSTLLYQLGLLDRPTKGSIKIDDLEAVRA